MRAFVFVCMFTCMSRECSPAVCACACYDQCLDPNHSILLMCMSKDSTEQMYEFNRFLPSDAIK